MPYIFKQQANLLKIELGTGGRKNKRVQARVRKDMKERKRMRDDRESSSDEDEEEEEESESFGELAQDVSETPLSSAEEPNIELEVRLNCQYSCNSASLSFTSEESDHEYETCGRKFPTIIEIGDDDE